MPELPEVETIRRDLEPQLRGRIITRTRLHPGVNGDVWNFIWAGAYTPGPSALQRPLVGRTISGVTRRGKYLSIQLAEKGQSAGQLVVHLGMTGQLTLKNARSRERNLRMQLELNDGRVLELVDPRRFGRVGFWKADEQPFPLAALSEIEPISVGWTPAYLADVLLRHGTPPIKATLLDQRVVAGLGNIYVDEALWGARVHPARTGGSLAAAEVRALVRTTRSAIERGIRNRGTSFSDYRDGKGAKGHNQDALNVYGRAGQPCRRCHTPLRATVVAGRGTSYCPSCQSAPRSTRAGAYSARTRKATKATRKGES